jgi:hypothetical protein
MADFSTEGRMEPGGDRMKLPLIYERAVPVSRHRHVTFSVQTSLGYGFAAKTNMAPIVAAEFASAAKEYPIVFVKSGDGAMPVALFGGRRGENPFVAPDGSWKGKYVPAFLRRYPFIFATADEPDKLVLCVDEGFAGLNQLGLGEPLFRADGEASALLSDATQFLTTFQRYSDQTKKFGEALLSAQILSPAKLAVAGLDGKKDMISGAMVVDRRKVKALPADSLVDLARRDYLELIYLHLASLGNGRVPVDAPAEKERAGMLLS